jgi:hypothetical protein
MTGTIQAIHWTDITGMGNTVTGSTVDVQFKTSEEALNTLKDKITNPAWLADGDTGSA